MQSCYQKRFPHKIDYLDNILTGLIDFCPFFLNRIYPEYMKQKINLLLLLLMGFSSNAFGKCVPGTVDCPPCMKDVKASNNVNEYPTEKLKEDQKKAEGIIKTDVIDKDYLYEAKNSAVKMLVQASKFYKDGAITKEQYIKVADQVSMMAEYADVHSYKDVDCRDPGVAGKCNKNFAEILPVYTSTP